MTATRPALRQRGNQAGAPLADDGPGGSDCGAAERALLSAADPGALGPPANPSRQRRPGRRGSGGGGGRAGRGGETAPPRSARPRTVSGVVPSRVGRFAHGELEAAEREVVAAGAFAGNLLELVPGRLRRRIESSGASTRHGAEGERSASTRSELEQLARERERHPPVLVLSLPPRAGSGPEAGIAGRWLSGELGRRAALAAARPVGRAALAAPPAPPPVGFRARARRPRACAQRCESGRARSAGESVSPAAARTSRKRRWRRPCWSRR